MKSTQRKHTRTRGWIGTRIEVCGYQLSTDPADLICHLPPNHYPKHIHATIAQDLDTDTPGVTVVIIQDNEKEQQKWLDVAPP